MTDKEFYHFSNKLRYCLQIQQIKEFKKLANQPLSLEQHIQVIWYIYYNNNLNLFKCYIKKYVHDDIRLLICGHFLRRTVYDNLGERFQPFYNFLKNQERKEKLKSLDKTMKQL
jgi:hypothetical protein